MALASGHVLVVLLAIAAQCTLSMAAKSRCPLGLIKGTTVVFVADDGAFSGTSEASYYQSNLQHKTALREGSVACAGGYKGLLMRQHVAVIVTGIGPTAAALCTYDVVSRCGYFIKDIFYSGTSGWSAQLGGVINNGSCSTATPNTAGIVRTGDVCVSPFSVNWDCRKASWQSTSAGSPNECTFPEQEYTAANSALFGQCQFSNITKQELGLSDEVLAAAADNANKLPTRSAVIQALDVAYWGNMSLGTAVNYPALSASDPPRVWGYKQCMEVDSQFFWSGAPWDMVARVYAADTLNRGLNVTTYTQHDMIAVSAMEAVGLSMAMTRYHALPSTYRRIPYTIVRGMSDWVHSPLVNQGSGQWAAAPAVENFSKGYKYAISTSSAVVLSTLQARCSHVGQPDAGRAVVLSPYANMPCSFTINYS